MKTLIKNEFRQTRKLLLIWLGIMLLLCGFCYFELLSLQDSLDEMAAMVSQFPRLIMIMFGVKGDLTTSTGWYVCIYFWEGLLAFPYAMSLGLSCVAKEKKFGTSEYLFTKPVKRKTIVLAKVIVQSMQNNYAGIFPLRNNNNNNNYGRETITDKIRRTVEEANQFSEQLRSRIGEQADVCGGDTDEAW